MHYALRWVPVSFTILRFSIMNSVTNEDYHINGSKNSIHEKLALLDVTALKILTIE